MTPLMEFTRRTAATATDEDIQPLLGLIDRALRSLRAHGAVINRTEWLQDAMAAEQRGSLLTAVAIVKKILPMGRWSLTAGSRATLRQLTNRRLLAIADVEEEDKRRTFAADAEAMANASSPACARAAWALAVAAAP